MENSATIKTDNNINPDPIVEEMQIVENESSRYSQDCHQLLTLLPKEVWDNICSFIGTKTFLNLNNSSLFFRQLFLRKRTLILYPPILEILIPKFEFYVDPSSITSYREDLRSVLLVSRAVCKTWKTAIDKKACIRKPEESHLNNLVQFIFSRSFRFKGSPQIDHFLQNFQATHPPSYNPSPAKSIHLHIRLMEADYSQLINRISTLLQKYLSPLKTLVARYYCKEGDVSLTEVFSMLSEKFGGSLENLNLRFRVSNKLSEIVGIVRESFNGRLNLAKVRRFEVEIESLFCLDFLLGMKENLEELIIHTACLGNAECGDFCERERGESLIIKFLGYEDKMLESNIWSMFPKLGRVKVNAPRKFGIKRDFFEFKREDWMRMRGV